MLIWVCSGLMKSIHPYYSVLIYLPLTHYRLGSSFMGCGQSCKTKIDKWNWHWQLKELMMTSSNGNIFRVTGPLCGEFTGPGEFPAQRPVTRSFDVFFDLRLEWGWWFETLSLSLWRQCNLEEIMPGFVLLGIVQHPTVMYDLQAGWPSGSITVTS